MTELSYDLSRRAPGVALQTGPLAWNWRMTLALGLNLVIWIAVFKAAAATFAG